ncbi:MAG: hypothetical protein AAB510_03155 [Patescibacteria group bacterium]
MIYLFAGDDFKKKHDAYDRFVKSIPGDVPVFSINRNNFNPLELESFYSGSGLFFKKCVVIFSGIFERKELEDFVLERLDLMKISMNSFVFLESKLLKPILSKFEKAGAEIILSELPKEKKEKFNNFLLADAFGDRNKLNLWIYYRQAVDRGVGLEELVGVLFWKMKDMIFKRNFSKFGEENLKDSARKLSYLLPEARKNGQDAEIVFEKFLLEVF